MSAPSCLVDESGRVMFRGRLTLLPVPASGPVALAYLPQDANGLCPCSPENGAFLVTTAAFTVFMGKREICFVRGEISRYVAADVNKVWFVFCACM
jgi:hypothetical protein